MSTLLSRISIDPAICHGKPCVRGLRYPVESLLELLSSGMTIDEILADYEDIEREDLLAVLAYHSWVGRGQPFRLRSEEHTSELQSRLHLVCRLLLEKKKT